MGGVKLDWSLERLSHSLCRRTNNWIKIEEAEDEDRGTDVERDEGKQVDGQTEGRDGAQQGDQQTTETDRLAENQSS